MTNEELMEILLEKRPSLAQHLRSDLSVLETARQYMAGHKLGDYGASMRKSVSELIRFKVSALYGPSQAEKFAAQFQDSTAFSTADHHGPLSFPLLVNSNLLHTIGGMAVQREFTFVLSCAAVPLSNVSFPRGWNFKSQRLPIVPTRFRNVVTLQMPKSDFSSFESAIERTDFNKEDKKFLRSIHEDLHEASNFESCENYSDQISVLCQKIWPRYFANSEGKPKLIYLVAEDIATKLLVNHVLKEPSLPLYQVIFDSKARDLFLERMANLPGAKGSMGGGTQLFWGAQSNGRPISLQVLGNSLVGEGFKLEINPAAISEALLNKKIYSSQAVFYGLFAFHAGYHLLGGFNQIEVLGKMKEAWLKIGEILQDQAFTAQLKEVRTDGLICGPELVETGGLESVMTGGFSDDQIHRISKQAFKDTITANLRTIVKIVS